MDFNFDVFSDILELVGNASDTTGQLAKTVGTIKALFQSSEGGANADIKLALSELTMQIANTQMTNADLKLKLTALQYQLAQLNRFQSDLDRYELWETPTGAVVYRLREAARNNQPLHYLCPACIEEKRKSILQGHSDWRQCTRCKAEYVFEGHDVSIQI